MHRFSRRQFVAAGVALTAGSAGCLSSGGDSTTPTEELGTIADSTTPTGDGTLPTPVAGDPEADVTVAAYEDYACPHCATYSLEVFPQLASDYLESAQVRYEFHDYPIPVDQTVSYQAANAARAVQANAGSQAFFEYTEALFANQRSLGPDTYASLADEFSVDGGTVREAATNERYSQTITEDRQRGDDRGVDSTPTVFVDGTSVQPDYESLQTAIEDALGQ